jgi:hypothetical protein
MPTKRKVKKVAKKVYRRHGGALTMKQSRTRAKGIIKRRKVAKRYPHGIDT